MGLQRQIFSEDHEIFRRTVRKFLEDEMAPHHEKWEDQGYVDREAWTRAGELGFLCMSMPEEFGGSNADRLYSAILMEETQRLNLTGLGFGLHNEIVAPYINRYGSEEQKRKYLPKMASGEMVGAIAMSEPGTGSDLQGIKTTALKDGNELVVNGQKTFITNGWNADVVIVVAKTDPEKGAKGTSLVMVERGDSGFEKGRRLKKLGMKAQDTSELFFDNVRIPADRILGEEGKGFVYLMQELAWERIQVAISAAAAMEAAVEMTVEYCKERKAFGQPLLEFQNTRFKLAEMKTIAQVARTFVDECLSKVLVNELDAETASMAKLWTSDMQNKVIDECLQLHGGYGYMWEYPITRMYADARVQRIYAGTNEIMKEIIARGL
ncbi:MULTISPECIES: acyl-CoA dehydrogenase family protein [unclassified Minwuia]|jgi:long-chain-acyl-CoA dehydrogenase|uniref:acyl-CoA dehydrogenase family protein n=1 Tax=unclassified Minwuia TaxID=2618799 RepID=UPI002478547F|nr:MULTISPECIES: acyl-CoA dehydrogenase family protein [unclassified Minwuia]MDF1731668.1 acyl-CoA dehydrogenase family protein [Minwuia sp.]